MNPIRLVGFLPKQKTPSAEVIPAFEVSDDELVSRMVKHGQFNLFVKGPNNVSVMYEMRTPMGTCDNHMHGLPSMSFAIQAMYAKVEKFLDAL